MTSRETQMEMGKVSNLITDMTIKGATTEELIPVIKHSMVVIDAEKHGLDWKRSEKDNHIDYYKRRYQIHADDPNKYGGAQTLISKAKSEVRVPERKDYWKIDPDTGEKIFKETGRTYQVVSKTGKVRTEQAKKISTAMYEAKDARDLISDMNTPVERTYATFANQMKALGNQARKEYISTGKIVRDKAAAIKYAEEVATLNAQLLRAKKNAPIERQAHILANAQLAAMKRDNPGMTKADIKVKGPKDSKKYISDYLKAHPKASKQIKADARKYSDAMRKVKNFQKEHPDAEAGTYSAATGKLVDVNDGYCVTFHQNYEIGNEYGGYDDETYAMMAAVAKNELGSDDVYIGFFGNPEISFNCKDYQKAKKFCVEHNQHSIYDAKTHQIWINREGWDEKYNPIKGEGSNS